MTRQQVVRALAQDGPKGFIRAVGQLTEGHGIHRTSGQVLAALLLAKNALSVDELVTITKVPRSSMGPHIRELVSIGAIQSEHVENDRREYYRLRANSCVGLWRIMARARKENGIDPYLPALRAAAEKVGTDESRTCVDLFVSIRDWLDRMQRLDDDKVLQQFKKSL